MAARRVHEGLRHLAIYALIVGVGLITLIGVLWLGGDIEPTPEVPDQAAVTGDGADCLGPRLAASQSGVFLDLHVPRRSGVETTGADPGPRIARGRIDRDTGEASLHGNCAANTMYAGQRFRAHLQLAAHDEAPRADGELVIGDEVQAVSLREASEDAGSASDDALSGSELTSRLFFAVVLVIIAARVVGSLFTRIRQPRVGGEIVAGILLGPSLVGSIVPGLTEFLFPSEVISALQILAQLGLVFFMFLVGMELDLALAARSGRTAILVSHVSIVVPFALGTCAALILYPLVGSSDFVSFTLFMGAAMAITAFPVLARILADTGLQRTRLGTLAITCAGVDDVTAWCILSVVVAVVRSNGAGDVARTVGLTLVFVLFMLVVVRPLAAQWIASRDHGGALDPLATVAALVGLLLSAGIAEEIGIHAIFGAFLMGVVMPRRDRLVSQLRTKLEDVTAVVLLPIFFAVVGLSTTVGALDQPVLWAATALVIVLAVAGKWGGSMVAGRACGLPWREASALGVLMNTRGLTEIVILTVGLSLGVVSPALFTIMVLMGLVTTFMATPLVLWLHRGPRVEAASDEAVLLAVR